MILCVLRSSITQPAQAPSFEHMRFRVSGAGFRVQGLTDSPPAVRVVPTSEGASVATARSTRSSANVHEARLPRLSSQQCLFWDEKEHV